MWLQTQIFSLLASMVLFICKQHSQNLHQLLLTKCQPSTNIDFFLLSATRRMFIQSNVHTTYTLHFNIANKDWAIVLTLFSAMYYFYGAIPFPHISHAKRGSSLPLFSLGNCGKRWKVSEPSKPYIPAKKWRKPVRIWG